MMFRQRAERPGRVRNLPVPDAPRAPVNARWLWWVAPPAAITIAYRAIPPRARRLWNPAGNASSHLGLAAILAGGGWKALAAFGLPYGGVSAGARPHRRTPWTLNHMGEPNMWWLPQPGGSMDTRPWTYPDGRASMVPDAPWLMKPDLSAYLGDSWKAIE